jgi:hypothetical protein
VECIIHDGECGTIPALYLNNPIFIGNPCKMNCTVFKAGTVPLLHFIGEVLVMNCRPWNNRAWGRVTGAEEMKNPYSFRFLPAFLSGKRGDKNAGYRIENER